MVTELRDGGERYQSTAQRPMAVAPVRFEQTRGEKARSFASGPCTLFAHTVRPPQGDSPDERCQNNRRGLKGFQV